MAQDNGGPGGGGEFPPLTEGKRTSRNPRPRSEGVPPKVDTMGLAFAVTPDFDLSGGRVMVHNALRPDEMVTVSHDLPGGGFVALGKGGKAWVEASAKRADPYHENVEALTPSGAVDSMREAYREALAFCEPAKDRGTGKVLPFDRATVVRLDPVRDFDGVTHHGELLDGLASVPCDPRWKVRRWQDPQRHKAESLRRGPKAWGATLYDKHAESRGIAPVGRLRSEGRLHQAQLTGGWALSGRFCVRQIADINDEKVSRMTRALFERVGFHREVQGRASLSSTVFGCEWLSGREKAELWAFLTAPGRSESMAKSTRLRYRRIASQLGVTFTASDEDVAPVFVRLDFDSGREVLRVA